jgi:hypothetical protein
VGSKLSFEAILFSMDNILWITLCNVNF